LQNKDCGESTIIDNNETKNNANQPKKIQQNKNENEVKLDMKKLVKLQNEKKKEYLHQINNNLIIHKIMTKLKEM